MSTGDQTAYIRSKIAERGSNSGAKFMRDGFDAWAESEKPARAGQEEKVGAEVQMDNFGGAMSVRHAKKYMVESAMKREMKRTMRGSGIIDDAKKYVKQLLDVYRGVSSWIDDLNTDLTDEIINNPNTADGTRKVAQALKDNLDKFKVYKDVMDAIASAASSVGLGRHGGAFSLEDLGKYAKEIIAWYNFFAKNAASIRKILGLKSLNVGPGYGKQLLAYLDPILSKVGMGGRRSGRCCCDSEDEYHGGADFTVEQVRTVGGRRRRAKKYVSMMGGASEIAPMYSGGAESFSRTGGPSELYVKGREPAGMRIGGYAERTLDIGPVEKVYGMRVDGGRKPSARGAIVKKVMAQHGLSLPQASKYVKEHGLY